MLLTRWLAHLLALPLEAPFEATRGWNIQSLEQGITGLSNQDAAAFALFCRYSSKTCHSIRS